MKSIKIALLASTTLDMLAGLAKAIGPARKLEMEWYIAPFNQYSQEILAPTSAAKEFGPNIVLLSVDAASALQDSDRFLETVEQAVEAFPTSAIFVHTLVSTNPDTLTLLDWNQPNSVERKISEVNIGLADLAQKHRSLYLLDLGRVVKTLGLANMSSPRFYYLGKIPFNKVGLQAIAEQFVMAVEAYLGRRKKVLVLDLDNTLWGGVIGEDGMDGIKLSNDAEGKAFYDFQKLLYKLWQSGVLLIVSSKNDEDIAMEVIRSHPYMILKENCFAAHRINWDHKAGNIRDMAAELNLGLDSFVYLDDSPQERAMVGAALPEVTIPELPKDASEYPTFLASLPYFETLAISDEDRNRGALYLQERERRDLAKSVTSIDQYYEQLEVKMKVGPCSEFEVPRVAQLTQRTNQFNASTKRYSRDEVEQFTKSDDALVLTCSASDKYGDYGLVGVAILKRANGLACVDTLLMSCRALGRGIEEAFVYCLGKVALSWSDEILRIDYEPTEKNKMVYTFLTRIGFLADGGSLAMEIDTSSLPPAWIDLSFSQG